MHQHPLERECFTCKSVAQSLRGLVVSSHCSKSKTTRNSFTQGQTLTDFSGSLSLPLNRLFPCTQEMPVIGYDTWFKLEPRSSTSKVQGECHLILKLFTSQVWITVIHFAGEFSSHMSWYMNRNAAFDASFHFFQRDTALSKRESNISIHKKLLSQIIEYEHTHVKVSCLHIFCLISMWFWRAESFSDDKLLKCPTLCFLKGI